MWFVPSELYGSCSQRCLQPQSGTVQVLNAIVGWVLYVEGFEVSPGEQVQYLWVTAQVSYVVIGLDKGNGTANCQSAWGETKTL